MAGVLLVVLALFVPPLFSGLGSSDLDGDESIYAGAIESVLAGGHWLTPQYGGEPFLEKPPLKFWLAAAVIEATPLDADERGFRTVDAICGAAAFAYLFLLGTRLAGILCGTGAVFLLAIHEQLLFVHGLRANDMDAMLVLAYCAAMYHFQRWSEGDHPRAHALAVAGWFCFGFLAKFVAALFLPLVLAACLLAVPEWRRRAWAMRRTLVMAAALAIAVIAPWFLYQLAVFGYGFWEFMFVHHVFRRVTGVLDPAHRQPWHFYVVQIVKTYDKVWYYPFFGALAWAHRVLRADWAAGIPVLVWLLLPLSLVSLSTSKLYHYAYPFVPPIALLGGYALVVAARFLLTIPDHAEAIPLSARRPLRIALSVVLGASLVVLVLTATAPEHRIVYDAGPFILRNASLARPFLLALVLLLALRGRYRTALAAVALCAVALDAGREYGRLWERTGRGERLLSSLAACLRDHRSVGADEVFAQFPPALDVPRDVERYLGPIRRSVDLLPRRVERRLRDASTYGPVIVAAEEYPGIRGLVRTWPPEAQASVGVLSLPRQALYLMLPGPYAACVAPGRARLD